MADVFDDGSLQVLYVYGTYGIRHPAYPYAYCIYILYGVFHNVADASDVFSRAGESAQSQCETSIPYGALRKVPVLRSDNSDHAVPYLTMRMYCIQNIVLLYADSCTRIIFGPSRCVRVQIPVTFLL